MTIGIAACGKGAAVAIASALASAETFASGAIGGFVSLAAIVEGRLERAEVQAGGATALLTSSPPHWMHEASCAVLMSSGPNRSPPLAQFTPGDAGIGLVTGHRFPNANDRRGQPINRAVLAVMRDGLEPQAAVDAIAFANPDADAGLLAVTNDGRIGLRDCAYLEQFADRGHVILNGPAGNVAVTHNSIAPHRSLALVVAELASLRLSPPKAKVLRIEIRAGIPLRIGSRNAIEVDENRRVTTVWVKNPALIEGRNSFGLGYRAGVIGVSGQHLQYEPYMVSENGVLISIDGAISALLDIA